MNRNPTVEWVTAEVARALAKQRQEFGMDGVLHDAVGSVVRKQLRLPAEVTGWMSDAGWGFIRGACVATGKALASAMRERNLKAVVPARIPLDNELLNWTRAESREMGVSILCLTNRGQDGSWDLLFEVAGE